MKERGMPEHDVPGGAGELHDPHLNAAHLCSFVHQRLKATLTIRRLPDFPKPWVPLLTTGSERRVSAGRRTSRPIGETPQR